MKSNKLHLLLFFSLSLSSILGRTDPYYDYQYYELSPGLVMSATSRDAYKDHYIKTVQYIVNLQTPGYMRTSVNNVREYNPKLGQYEVNSVMSFKWLEGAIVETGRPLDFAIDGQNRAFFTIQLPDQLGYIRDGRFFIDGDNRLVTLSGNFPVVNANGGYIYATDPNGDFSSSRSGGLYNNNAYIGHIKVTVFNTISDMDEYLVQASPTIYTLTNDIATLEGYEHYSVIEGYIQQSNTFKSNDSGLYKNFYQASNGTLERELGAQKTSFSILQP